MNKLLTGLRENSVRVYGSIFALIMLSALLVFFLSQAGLMIALCLFLAVIVVANVLVILI